MAMPSRLIHLTQKPLPSSSESSPQILIRATNGYHIPNAKTRIAKYLLPLRKPGDKRVKISTAVDAAEIEEFYAKYAEVSLIPKLPAAPAWYLALMM
ncbi:hypothetical protein DV737_g4215, partial [Chaetothyriales sp. CBS 132003]